MVTAATKLKDTCSLEENYDKPRQYIKKQRHYFADKDPNIQNYGFSSIHVWILVLDHKEGWMLKNWCFELWCWKSLLRIPLFCKDIIPVNPKGNQSSLFIQFTSTQLLSLVQLFATSWNAAHQASLSTTNSWSLLKLMSMESVMQSNHLILCHSLPSSPTFNFSLASGSFTMSQFFISSGWGIGASSLASVPPVNIQDWFPLGVVWLDWLVWSPCSPRSSQKSFPTPQLKSINSLAHNLLYGPALTSIHDYWKNHSFDWTDLCHQSNVSAF